MLDTFLKFSNKLSTEQKRMGKELLRRVLSIYSPNHSLKLLAMKHGTDKWSHGYIEFYHKYFEPIRKKKLNILEIGVGGYKDPQSGGASLRMWQDYFVKSMIYSIDIADKSYHENRRIKIFRGSQNDTQFLEHVAETIGSLDIIIDDGSHISKDVIASFSVLFPYLSNGGIYVIEDLHTSYWPSYGGNWRDLNQMGTTMGMLKNLVDGINCQFIPNRSPKFFDGDIESIHFYPKIVFIFKGKGDHFVPNYMIEALEREAKK